MLTESEKVNYWVTELLKKENSEKNYVDFFESRQSEILRSGGYTTGKLYRYALRTDLSCMQAAQKIQRGDDD